MDGWCINHMSNLTPTAIFRLQPAILDNDTTLFGVTATVETAVSLSRLYEVEC